MKKVFLVNILVMSLIGIICLSCGKSKMKGDSGTNEGKFAVSPETQSTTVGNTVSYKATVSYSDTDTDDVTDSTEWSSSDESIAKSEGSGKFTALDIGSIEITANHKTQSEKVTLDVERPEQLDEGDRYSTLVWGIENCLGWEADTSYQLKNDTWVCHGDCNDAYLVITGDDLDVSLGISNNKLYMVSNKDQSITFKTYIDAVAQWGDTTYINDKSKLTVDIKDRSDKVVKSKDLVIFPTNQGWLDEVSIDVKKWYSIDITSKFEGTVVGEGKSCPISSSKLSKLRRNKGTDDKKAGYIIINSERDEVNNPTKIEEFTSTKIN